MPNDDKRKRAYELAKSMDEQTAAELERLDEEQKKRFLKTIAQIESSGGKDFSHSMMEQGLQKGTSAIGRYGLMPNTVQEIGRRAKRAGTLTPEMEKVMALGPAEMKSTLENNPELERQFANQLAERVLDKYNRDEAKAAYGWLMGHNISPQRMRKEPYEESDYVKKYKRFKKSLFGRD